MIYKSHFSTSGFLFTLHLEKMKMNRYPLYHIKDSDRFDPFHFPKVETEIIAIAAATAGLTSNGKQQAIISYLKHHSMRTEWVNAHPVLAKQIAGDIINTSHVESLFDSGKNNLQFILDLENYIRNTI